MKAGVILLLIPLLSAVVAGVSVKINISGQGNLAVYENGKEIAVINKTTTITVPAGAQLTFFSNTPFTVNGDFVPRLIYNMTVYTNTTVCISFINQEHQSKLHYIAVGLVVVAGLAGLAYLSSRRK